MSAIDIGQETPRCLTLTWVRGTDYAVALQATVAGEPVAWPNPPRLTFTGGWYIQAQVPSEAPDLAVFLSEADHFGKLNNIAKVALHDPASGRVYATGSLIIVQGVPA